jgi:hypothetical protein
MVPSYDILSMGEAVSLDRFVHSQSGRGNQRMNVVVSNLSWLSWIIVRKIITSPPLTHKLARALCLNG